MKIRALLLSMVVAAVSTTAMAETMGTPAEQKACKADVRKHCSQVSQKAGTEAFKACLQENFDKLSPKCQAALKAHG